MIPEADLAEQSERSLGIVAFQFIFGDGIAWRRADQELERPQEVIGVPLGIGAEQPGEPAGVRRNEIECSWHSWGRPFDRNLRASASSHTNFSTGL